MAGGCLAATVDSGTPQAPLDTADAMDTDGANAGAGGVGVAADDGVGSPQPPLDTADAIDTAGANAGAGGVAVAADDGVGSPQPPLDTADAIDTAGANAGAGGVAVAADDSVGLPQPPLDTADAIECDFVPALSPLLDAPTSVLHGIGTAMTDPTHAGGDAAPLRNVLAEPPLDWRTGGDPGAQLSMSRLEKLGPRPLSSSSSLVLLLLVLLLPPLRDETVPGACSCWCRLCSCGRGLRLRWGADRGA